MLKFNLLPFQIKAVDELKNTFITLWKSKERKLPLVFKSPTGSGKTFMVCNFINELNNLPNWDVDKAFIWITFSDDIAMQSKEKYKLYFENNLKNTLLTVSDINRSKLLKNDILFLNWQKIVSKSAENRVLRRPEDELMQKESGCYFEDFMDNTHKSNREIILIVDEVHKNRGTKLAQEIIDYINPKIILEISATPEFEPTISQVKHNQAGFVEVDREEVVKEGLIKEKILVQSNEDLQKHKGKDLDIVLLELGFNKRLELKKQFKNLGKNINPLMLIQLPNDDNDLIELGQPKKEEIVLKYLSSKKVNPYNIASWFDNKKENLDDITDNESEVEFMLFKQAAGTGWDCPRAHVLVMFREIKKSTFYVQTVGRILRMAEPDKKEDFNNHHELRTGFLFTNYQRDEIAIPDQSNANKPKIFISYLKENLIDKVKDFKLESSFISRVDYGDLASSYKFQMSFVDSMNKYFNLTEKDLFGKELKKLKEKGIELNPIITNKIIVDASFEDFDQLYLDFHNKGTDLDFEVSHNDIEKTFNYFCYQLLKEQTDDEAKISNIARSWAPFKSALRVWMKNILGDDSRYYYKVFVNDILKGASSKFRPAITNAIKEYRPILKEVLKERQKKLEEKETLFFIFKDYYSYTDEYIEIEQKKCLYEKCFIRNELGKNNEENFIKYIDKKDSIEWWFKNGDYGKDYYAIKYFNISNQTDSLFYPDWILKLNNGKIGIFDTKGGFVLNTEGRAKALTLKLKKLGSNYFGGIVRFANGIYEYCNSINFDDNSEKNNKWLPLEDLLN